MPMRMKLEVLTAMKMLMVVVTSVSAEHTASIFKNEGEVSTHLQVYTASQPRRPALRDNSKCIKSERKVMWYSGRHINEFWVWLKLKIDTIDSSKTPEISP
jgi:hypothetical protein